ncbi:uncharacterized protein Dana_GF17466 [Drosophila ananassae]|uniref:G-protein coupled receptors family 2 profile 2 domain-containing protein n=1 Tax=Drosophila ananassae TaxID=7217 RepID=B3LVZ1_DROAN|nr:probable G-protein coupled receptor Mth-like 11 [Drosophila ananassae]EDV41524.2 uncharacterized protein Dana_GF17466 [Drosophila ananassae]
MEGKHSFRKFQLLILFVTGIRAVDIPNCNFFDTVNISGSVPFSNGSYSHEGVFIPARLTGSYNYQIDHRGSRWTVPEHIRGCVCQLKTCVRLCCHHTQFWEAGECIDKDPEDESPWDYSVNVTLMEDGSVQIMDFVKDMVNQHDTPLSCVSYRLDARKNPDDPSYSWTLYENGALLRHYDSKWLSKMEYCMQPTASETGQVYLMAYNCASKEPLTMVYVRSGSALFLAITSAVYLWLPKFHTLHGRCCLLYFGCLATTYVLNVISIFGVFDQATPMCRINGFAGYFMAMSTFLWLSVISFDIWRTFGLHRCPSSPSEAQLRFWYYNLTVWTTATLLTLVIFLVTTLIPKDMDDNVLVPQVGEPDCWIYILDYSALIYFYLPLGVLVAVNGIFFFLTTRKIYEEHRSIRSILTRHEAHRSSRNQASYRMYLRLFIIMGCNWILEFVAYVCQINQVAPALVDLNEVINCAEGFIIFVVTICNRETILETFNCLRRKERDRSITDSSSRQDSTRVRNN